MINKLTNKNKMLTKFKFSAKYSSKNHEKTKTLMNKRLTLKITNYSKYQILGKNKISLYYEKYYSAQQKT